MENNNRLPSFTLIEMLVVIIISSIIVSLSFVILNILQEKINKIESNYEKGMQELLFQERLKLDFNRFQKITWDGKNRMHCISPRDSVTYLFNENTFLTVNADTVYLDFDKPEFYYKGSLIQSGILDAVRLKFKSSEENIFVTRPNDIRTHIEYGNQDTEG